MLSEVLIRKAMINYLTSKYKDIKILKVSNDQVRIPISKPPAWEVNSPSILDTSTATFKDVTFTIPYTTSVLCTPLLWSIKGIGIHNKLGIELAQAIPLIATTSVTKPHLFISQPITLIENEVILATRVTIKALLVLPEIYCEGCPMRIKCMLQPNRYISVKGCRSKCMH